MLATLNSYVNLPEGNRLGTAAFKLSCPAACRSPPGRRRPTLSLKGPVGNYQLYQHWGVSVNGGTPKWIV